MTDPQLLPDFQAQLDHTLELRSLIQGRLDAYEPLHEQAKFQFNLTMMRMGPKTRADAQFTIKANEKTLTEMREQLETCNTQIRLLQMCINAVAHMEKQRAEQTSLSDFLPGDPDGGTVIA